MYFSRIFFFGVAIGTIVVERNVFGRLGERPGSHRIHLFESIQHPHISEFFGSWVVLTNDIFIPAQLKNVEILFIPILDRSMTGISGIFDTGLPLDYAGNTNALL